MGLSPAYVARILNMIMGYKHIRDGRITELGLDSLENGRKKTLIPARQLMQADAVTGNLLEIDRNVPAVRLHDTGKYTRSLCGSILRRRADGICNVNYQCLYPDFNIQLHP